MPQPFPGTITSVTAQAKTRKHLGQRVNVFVDGKYSFALDIQLVEKHNLNPGTVLDAEFLSRLLQEDGDAKATAQALHFMGYRARSVNEVRERLKRDDWPDEVIARVLERLRDQNYLNDENFSAQWVENRSLSRPRGARMLQQELRQKGVARETIDASLPDDEAERDNAVFALQKQLRSKERAWQNLEEKDRREKAIQFMMRRGFNYGTAKAAWATVHEEEEA